MFLVFAIPFAIGAYLVAGRMGRNQVLWVVLTIIPFVNMIFYIYAMFAILLYVLDKLNAIAPPAAAQAGVSAQPAGTA